MTKIVVTYRNGRTWVCEVEAVGDGDAGEICAAAGAIELIGGALVFEPAVMSWRDGKWRAPMGIVDEWTESSTGFVDASGRRREARSSSAFSQRRTIEEEYAHVRYTLLAPAQLEGAVSVTVNGVLTYSSENGKLVPVVGGEDDGTSSMTEDFATYNRPASAETFAGMAHAGISFEPEVM